MLKMVLFVCLSCLDQKLCQFHDFLQHSRWPPTWPPLKPLWPSFRAGNNMYDIRDPLRDLKMQVKKIACYGDRWPPFLLD